MESKPLVTIIIPIFNLANRLEQCLRSIQNQTYQNWEVIMVDDGSTDDSARVCNDFLADQRFNYIYQNNHGVSSARNNGLGKANGRYITFIDGDDYIDTDHIETMVANFTGDVDMTVVGRKNIKNNKVAKIFRVNQPQIVSQRQLIDACLKPEVVFSFPWNKLYSSAIIADHRLRFDESISFGEDLVFNVQYMLKTRKAIICDTASYNYVDWQSNVSKRMDEGALISRLTDLTAIQKTIDLMNGQNYQNEITFLYKRIAMDASKDYRTMNALKFSSGEQSKCKKIALKAYNRVKDELSFERRLSFNLNLYAPFVASVLAGIKNF